MSGKASVTEKWLWFDMDGTIYNLYDIPNWLDKLEHGDMSVFLDWEHHRRSLNKIIDVCINLRKNGWHIGVISWAPKGVDKSNPTFNYCANAKRLWLTFKFMPCDKVHILEYGTPKESVVNSMVRNVLVDDNAEVRKAFRNAGFETINASRGYIAELEKLL